MTRSFPGASRLLFVTAAVAALAAGCGAGNDTDSGNSDIHIHPVGTDQLSTLTLQLPTNSCQPGGGCARPLGSAAVVTIDGNTVALGATTTLQPGAHIVGVDGLGWKVTLAPAEKRTAVLPIAHVNCIPATPPTVPATDFGSTVTLQTAICPTAMVSNDAAANPSPAVNPLAYFSGTGCYAQNLLGHMSNATVCSSLPTSLSIGSVSENGTCSTWGGTYSPQQMCQWYEANQLYGFPPQSPGGTGVGVAALASTDIAYVPGGVTIATNATTQTFTLAEGDEQTFDIALPVIGTVPATFSTQLAFLDPRDNPDAMTATITSSCSGERAYIVPAGVTSTLSLNAFVNTGCSYTLNVGGRTVLLDQTQGNAINLHRVDVDDVTITRDTDGTTYTVRGTYQLNFGGTTVAGPFQTATGIDVLSGSYDLIINYTDANGAQTQDQTFTL